MIVIPAIDLQAGRCVRLRQGRADEATVYGGDPVAMARHWQEQGARALHVVDLDGAFAGRPVHGACIAALAAALTIPLQVGGGLRRDEDIRDLLAGGVTRAILGTRALDDPEALRRLVDAHGARLAVGIDARDGWVQVKGWVETLPVRAVDLARRVAALGIDTLIYTDTATDGMLAGPNLAALDELCRAVPACGVIASGGVSTPAHVRALRALRHVNLAGAIVGRALYEGCVTLAELQAAADENPDPSEGRPPCVCG